ncbi:MAG: transposase [Desulfomonile tiedjei]|nr:transposase [Desulfomonile tiedjei]
MSEEHVPQPFAIEEIFFRACFSAPSWGHFIVLLIGWVLTVGKHTISNVILTMKLEELEHFASAYRFLSRAVWNIDDVSQRLFSLIVEFFVPPGSEVVSIVDDSLYKHCGKKICGAGWQYDGSAPKHARNKGYGLCFVVMGVAVSLPGISGRVFCLPYAARFWWPERTKVSPKRLKRKSKPELAAELIHLTNGWLDQGRTLRVVGDIAYTCQMVLKSLPAGTHFTGRVRLDSALYEPPVLPIKRPQGRPRMKGERLPIPAEMFQDSRLPWREIRVLSSGSEVVLQVYHLFAIWYHVLGPQIVAFLLVHDPSGTHANAVFLDTDVCATSEEIAVRYFARWSIEITNRETKQLLGAADPQCRSELSVIRTPMLAYWAYSLVVLWFVRQFAAGKRLVAPTSPWYRRKMNITFSDMLAAARRSHMTLSFSRQADKSRDLPKNNPARSTRGSNYTKRAKL